MLASTAISDTTTTPAPTFNRERFAKLFLHVSKQLETLEPPTSHLQHQQQSVGQAPHASKPMSHVLPVSRVHALITNNERFRPCVEMQPKSTADDAATNNVNPTNVTRAAELLGSAAAKASRYSVASVVDALLTDKPAGVAGAATSSTAAAVGQVHIAVGGKVRVLPTAELARAKAAMRKRSHALCNLHPVLGADRRTKAGASVQQGPGSTWDLMRSASSANLAVGKQALIAELVRRTNFTTQNIFQMSRKFKAIAGANKSVISFDEFRQIMSEDMGSLLMGIGIGTLEFQELQHANMSAIGATISSSETFLRRLFVMFDADSDGKIDFREFVVGLNGFVKGTAEEKVHALFEIYQSNTDKQTVAISDLLGLFQSDRQLYQELMHCVDEYFVRVELRDENTMKEEEFVAASLAEPHLLEIISRPTPSRKYAADGHVRDMLRSFIEQKNITWLKLLRMHRAVVDCAAVAQLPPQMILSKRASVITGSAKSIGIDARQASIASTTVPTDKGAATPACLPAADFHSIVLDCLGPSTMEDEALLQRLLLAYVVSPREKAPATAAVAAPTDAADVGATKDGVDEDDALSSGTSEMADVKSELLRRTTNRGDTFVAHVACGELTQDIAVALQTTLTAEHDVDSKARYYFELYDMNNDGLLSRNELCAAVCSGFAHFGQNVMEVVRILEDEDEDKDGELTKDEYMRAAGKSPLILASLYTCLQRET